MSADPSRAPSRAVPLEPPGRAAPSPFPPALLAALVLLALACRGSSLSNGWVNYDDPQVRAEAASKTPWEILTGPFYFAYKPVYGLSLSLDHALFGDAPLGWHAGNVALFALATALVALVAHGMLGSRFLAGATAALFAAHPVHAESVSWVAERKDSLSLVLALLAHLAYRRCRARRPGRPSALAPALLLLAGLAKGTVWTYAGVIAIDEVVGRGARPGRLQRLLPLLLVAGSGVLLDLWAGARFGPGAVRHPATTPELAAAMAGVHARYVLSLLWPFGLSVDYPVDPAGSWASPLAWIGAALALAAAAGLALGVLRRRPLLAAGCGLWVLGFLPVNNLLPATSILRADRYLLIPGIGAYLLAAGLLAGRRGLRVPVVLALVAGLGVLASQRGPVWASSDALWSDAIAKEPGSAIARINRASDEAERGAWVAAEADAAEGARLAAGMRRPELVLRARLLRSTSLLALGRAEEALVEANAALGVARDVERTPWLPGEPTELKAAAYAAIGQALETRARISKESRAAAEDFTAATKAYRAAVEADPRSFDGWRNLGNLLAALGGDARLDEAADALRKAAAIRPDDVDTIGYLVRVLYRQGKDAEAKALYDRASRRLGSPRALRRVEARLGSEVGDPAEADRKLSALLAEDPDDGETRAVLLAHRKRVAQELLGQARLERDPEKSRKAVEAFDRALKTWPSDADAEVGAGDALLQLARFHDARLRYAKARSLLPGARWIANLEARAGALEAVFLARVGQADEAARVMAEVVRLGPPRLDLGFAALEAEIPWMGPAADALEGREGADRALAGALLRAAAQLVGGDEDGAREGLQRAASLFGAMPPADSRLGRIYDGCHLLLAIVRGRRADVLGARRELEPVATRRPGDPVVAYHVLLLDRVEALAKARIAAGAGDEPGREAAARESAAIRERAAALCAASPPWPGPGLLAAEIDIQRGEFLPALRGLSALLERFPQAASVQRGVAAVYQAQSLEGGDRTALLGQAQAALLRAKDIDPRDPRTALDLSQLYRLTGDLDAAARYALSAASVEPIPGPASRALGAIVVEQGRKAYEAHELDKALSLAGSAAKADAGAAGPLLLEGDVWMARQELDKALKAYLAARGKEPANLDVVHALAECRRVRGGAYYLWRQRYPRPRERDGKAPDPAAVAEWDRTDLLARRQAVLEFEDALRLEPEAEASESVRSHLERLRALDPEAAAQNASAARKAYDEGEALRLDGKRVEALERYRQATALFREHFPAWMRIAETCVELGPDYNAEGIRAVEQLWVLDPERQYPEPDLYAGRIWQRIWSAAKGEPSQAALAAKAAGRARELLTRFLSKVDATTARGAANVEAAKGLLATLPVPAGK